MKPWIIEYILETAGLAWHFAFHKWISHYYHNSIFMLQLTFPLPDWTEYLLFFLLDFPAYSLHHCITSTGDSEVL